VVFVCYTYTMTNIHQELLTRPTYLEIDMEALKHNYHQLRTLAGDSKMLCIVKGNAYGHGSIEMAKAFQLYGADYLGVAIPEEGIELRRAGVTIPILVLSAISDIQIPVCIQYDLTITAPSDEKLQMINDTAKVFGKKAKVHIKVDTGMGRIGVNWNRVEKFLPIMQQSEHVEYEGLFAHFAMADEESHFTNTQIERFDHVLDFFRNKGINFKHVHHANSGGLIFHPPSRYSMVRAGMALYGYFEGRALPDGLVLKPVMTWKTEVVYFKYIEPTTAIGYGHHFKTDSGTRIVTLPVGYADGYQRAMGTQGKVIIRDTMYPIAGRICMDQMMVDIGLDGTAYKGDEVILVGGSENYSISFYDIARWSNTSIYELMSQISYRVPRKYINS